MNLFRDQPTILENDRKKFFLDSKTGADCRFLVGGKNCETVVYGHKVLFSIASAVFKTMFYGDAPEKGDEIEIPDIQPDTFYKLKEYIYMGRTKITSVKDTVALWYAANKYDINKLKNYCINFLCDNLKPSNICKVHKAAIRFNHSGLIDQCKKIILTKTSVVLNHSSFLEADLATMNFILDQDFLQIDSEVELFEALQLYIDKQRRIINENNSKEKVEEQTILSVVEDTSDDEDADGEDNEKPEEKVKSDENDEADNEDSLKDLVKKIRFLTMTPEEFAGCTKNSTLLSTSEMLNILFNITTKDCKWFPMPDGFCINRRKRFQVEDEHDDIMKASKFVLCPQFK